MSDSKKREQQSGRRSFLGGALASGAAVAASLAPQAALAADPKPAANGKPSALPPSGQGIAAESGVPPDLGRIEGKAGSDFMVDVIKTLDIKYLPSNCASSFRALHESLIDYGGNTMPEFLTCMHEESAAAMAHGYFKASGKPLLTLCHGTVGLQHAAMAVYNAWCDRVPMIIVGGAAFIILMQVPALASGLAGGVQLGTLGAIGWVGNKARSAIGSARPQNLRTAARRIRRDYMAVKAGASTAAAPARWVANRVRPGNSVAKAA